MLCNNYVSISDAEMKQKKTWQSYMSPTILARWHRESKNCPQEKFKKILSLTSSAVVRSRPLCLSAKVGLFLNSKSPTIPEMNTTNHSQSKLKLSKNYSEIR